MKAEQQNYYVSEHPNIKGSFAVSSHSADAHCKQIGVRRRPCFGVYKVRRNAERKAEKLNALQS